MDHTLFSALLKNLLSVDVTDATDMDSSLYAFEKEYCFSIKMQPMFTSKALYYLLSSSKESMIYELIDQLGICLSFFTFDNRIYIIGPYVKEKYSELKTETVLAKNDESSSKSLAFKLYYTAFPIVYTEQITSVVNKCIISFSPTESEYSYRRLSGFIQDVSEEDDKTELSEKNYSEIYRRYDQEKQFLSMIRNGDTKNIMTAFEKLSGPAALSDFSKETLNYYASGYGLAILKALSRKAAEESGLSVITIDEITQKYTQLSSATNNADLQVRLIGKDRDASGALHWIGIHDGVAVVHAPGRADRAAGKQQLLAEGRFSGIHMRQNSHGDGHWSSSRFLFSVF